MKEHLAKQMMIAIPMALVIQRYQEHVTLLQSIQNSLAAASFVIIKNNMVTQLGTEPLKD